MVVDQYDNIYVSTAWSHPGFWNKGSSIIKYNTNGEKQWIYSKQVDTAGVMGMAVNKNGNCFVILNNRPWTPFAGIYGEPFTNMLEDAGIGFSKEVELITIANKKDIFTVAWAFDPSQSARMAKAGADIIGAMIGLTTGGLSGAKETITLERATKDVQEIYLAAKEYNKDIIVITHGGPFEDVKTAKYSIQNSGAVGYASGSSGERVPTEKAVVEITRRYKSIDL